LVDIDYKQFDWGIDSMGVSEPRELINIGLLFLLAHLLKWYYQPSFQGYAMLH